MDKTKLKYISLVIAIMLVGLITAQVIIPNITNTSIPKEQKNKLASYGIIEPQTTDLMCDDTHCYFKMYQIIDENTTYNLGSHQFLKEDLTLQQMRIVQEEVINEWLINYAEVLKQREQYNRVKVADPVTININEDRG